MYRTFHITILQLEVLSSSNEERMSEGVSVPVKEKNKGHLMFDSKTNFVLSTNKLFFKLIAVSSFYTMFV